MKLIREKILANGVRRVTYEVRADETIIAVRDGMFYQIGYPMEDIIASHILRDIELVVWDSLEQRWIK